MQRSQNLISTAKKLAAATNRSKQTDLRRAVSTAYYALFHTLAKECADQLVGKTNKRKIRRAWAQAYRGLQHRRVNEVCTNGNRRVRDAYLRFPDEVRHFGDAFSMLQKLRHKADYDPLMDNLKRSEVLNMIAMAETAIVDFKSAEASARRAFCVFVMLDLRS